MRTPSLEEEEDEFSLEPVQVGVEIPCQPLELWR